MRGKISDGLTSEEGIAITVRSKRGSRQRAIGSRWRYPGVTLVYERGSDQSAWSKAGFLSWGASPLQAKFKLGGSTDQLKTLGAKYRREDATRICGEWHPQPGLFHKNYLS
ncbi:MAG: hypothetical protein ABSE41_00565 [Bacteroidota bacterium]